MRRYTILCEDSHCESIFLEVTLFSSSFFLYICFRPCHSFHVYRFLCEYIHTTCITGMLRYSLFILNMRRKILRLHPLCHSTLNRKKNEENETNEMFDGCVTHINVFRNFISFRLLYSRTIFLAFT